MILFFDTETTGKANFKLPCDHPSQPRVVQLGAIMTTEEGKEISSINLIIKPEVYTIPEEATAIHGISQEIASSVGLSAVRVLNIFHELTRSSATFVAHNIEFDEFVLKGEFLRHKYKSIPFKSDAEYLCTMKGMMNYCKLPGGYNGEYKWPSLMEAYFTAFGQAMDGEHDAMADVRACMALHFWIVKKMAVPA